MSGSSNALLDAIANPKPVDVAGAYGTANRLAQGIWANRLAQSQQAAGQAALGAIGPDGTFNAQRLYQNLAADPSTAMSAQESMQRGSTNATTDFDLHMKRLTGLNAAAMALTAQYPNGVPQDAVNKEIDRVAPTYGISPQEATTLKSQFPGDPVGNSRMLIRNGIANLTAQESLHASRPGATTVDTGPAVVGANVAPAAADQPGALAVPAGQGVQLQTGPGANAALVEVSDAAGNKYNVPRMSLPGASGVAGGAAVDYSGKPNPLLGGLPNPPENGAPATATPPSGVPAGATLSQVAPATTAAATETAGQNAKLGTALVTRADSVPVNKAAYGNMLTDLAKLDTMGPVTGREATINGILQKLTGYGITMDKSQVAGAESFAKIANMIAAQQLGSLGPTDARQSLAMGANPHLDLSKLGNTQIIHMLQGNEDAINAKAQAWQKWIGSPAQGGLGNSPGTYGTFSSDFNHNFDPRVFQQRYMGAKEIGDLRASMTGPGEAAKFKADTIYAREQGWIK